MNNNPHVHHNDRFDLASSNNQQQVETALRGLHPRPAELDLDSLDREIAERDALLQSPTNVSTTLPRQPLAWSMLAAAWGFGVAVGVGAMVILQGVARPVALEVPPRAKTESRVRDASADRPVPIATTEESPAPVTPAATNEKEISGAVLTRGIALWQPRFFEEDLRAGAHLLAMTKRRGVGVLPLPPSTAANSTNTFDASDDHVSTKPPASQTTQRELLDALLQEQDKIF